MTATHETDRHAKKCPRAQRVPKEEAIFDTELQRYVMPNERLTMPKQCKT
jgi:hypothetical protein